MRRLSAKGRAKKDIARLTETSLSTVYRSLKS
ncbi:helix-turn-helix domain-containing protein [Pseudoalteromonas rubra]